MTSPQGSARLPARLDRDGSISPQPLDTTAESKSSSSPLTDHGVSRYSQDVQKGASRSPFATLPSSVISRILWSVDANSFASLTILNREWREEAQKVELYAHHLSRCPSYALSNSIISGPFRKNDLARLRAKFAAEVRRNLFDAYLSPRRTLINLISINANSSAAFPTGEAFRFEFSPNAQTVLALSSSRIYILDATVDPPAVKRHLKTLRRPLSASITDDGSLLAVLSSKHQVNIYGLTSQGVQHLQVIVLDHPPKIIAMAHEGTVLAASYETGIEVFSLAANSLTTDRRAVRSEAVDALNFSGDGSMLVGSSLSLDDPNAVVISAPFYTENDPDLSPREVHSRMWTTQILFPQISSVCSHVALLPGHIEGDACWLFAFDHSLMSYRAVRTDDTRAGVAYFLSPPGADRFDTPVPTIAPSATVCGTLAVAGFEGAGLWVYGIPERLDISPDMAAVVERQNECRSRGPLPLTTATGNMDPLLAYSPSNSASDYSIEDDSLASKVDWRQSLFVKSKNVHGLPGQTAARWVEHVDIPNAQCSKRLIVVAPGGVSFDSDELGEEMMPVDGSRMCLLDFDYAPSTSMDRILTIEVGEDDAELLTEHTGSLATEVALERRRTIRAMPTADSGRVSLGRSVTSILPPSSPLFEEGPTRGSVSTPSSPTEQVRGSQVYAASGLHRATTVSGFRHARYPPRPPLGSAQYDEHNHSAYQRTGYYGRPTSEDSWETPPPPYAGANSPTSAPHASYDGRSAANEQHQNPIQSFVGTTNLSPEQQQYRPYRDLVAERGIPVRNTIMSSTALPSGATISQYGELAMAARTRGPSETSLDTVAEIPWNASNSPDLASGNRVMFTSRMSSDRASLNRPLTHHGAMPYGWQRLNRPMTLAISPISSTHGPSIDDRSAADPVSSTTNNRISLTGANLQNRLNHPVPPIPEVPRPFQHHTGYRESQQIPVNGDTPRRVPEGNNNPSLPTPDQVANLHRRISQSEMQRPPAIKNTNFVHRASAIVVPPSPPRGAWGATGITGSPTTNQARNTPNGYSMPRPNSQGSQISHLASASAPNLLAQRPRYGRLDTIESMNDGVGHHDHTPGVRSRSHSMTQVIIAPSAEPSAYHETSRAGAGPTKSAKKSKKKKEEPVKKGSRCVLM